MNKPVDPFQKEKLSWADAWWIAPMGIVIILLTAFVVMTVSR